MSRLHFAVAAFVPVLAQIVIACSSTEAIDAEATTAPAALVSSPDLVISQIFGGGGNTSAAFTHDYIELFNRGTHPVSLGGKALQVAGKDANFGEVDPGDHPKTLVLPNVMLAPGRHYLIQLNQGDAGDSGVSGGRPLPSADLVTVGADAFSIDKKKGKVALVPANALLAGCGSSATPCAANRWIDFVGYGDVSQFEGAPVPAMTSSVAAIRKGNGCVDTGNNLADFVVAAPTPQNGAVAAQECDE